MKEQRNPIWFVAEVCLVTYGWMPARLVFAVLVGWGCMVTLCLQMSLNLSIVAMVNQTAIQSSTRTSKECYLYDNRTYDSKEEEAGSLEENGEFDWNPWVQGLVLGGFFFGNVSTHLLGGLLAQHFGCKSLVLLGLLIPSLLSLVLPYTTRLGGAAVLFALRTAQGFTMGVLLPTLYAMVARWAPVLERSLTVSVIYVGGVLGSSLTMLIAGYLTSRDSRNGWTHVFYLSGGFGCFFCLVWSVLAHETPSHHPSITNDELQYITKSLSQENSISSMQQEQKGIPWRSVLGCIPLWSLLVVRCTGSWGGFVIQTATPLYLKTVLHVPLKLNGLINGMIYLTASVSSVLCSLVADAVRKRTRLTTSTVRKSVSTLAYVGSAACWLTITRVGCNQGLTFAIILSTKFFSAMSTAGDYVTIVDMAPKYAGPLSGIIYSLADCTGFLCPLITGIITKTDVTLERWSVVFDLCAGILLLGLIQFVIFGTAELQSWAKNQNPREDIFIKRAESETSCLLTNEKKTTTWSSPVGKKTKQQNEY